MDRIAPMQGGATAPWWIRADDGLSYVVKDEIQGETTVRASEWIWLSIAQEVRLPAPKPELIEDHLKSRVLVGTRREQSTLGKDHASCQNLLFSGQIIGGSTQLSRIYAFDLFSGNYDRHLGNYLIVEDGQAPVLMAIDFSHTSVVPGNGAADPLSTNCNTKAFYPEVILPYGHDIAAALEIINRLERLDPSKIGTIIAQMPDDWLSNTDKSRVHQWWQSDQPKARAALVRQELAHAK
jgi:hypothetical protein